MKDLRIEYLDFTDERVASAWKSMETEGMSPFLYYDYLHYVYTDTVKSCKYFPKVACILSADETVMLVALKKSLDLRYWKMLGDIQGCDRTDAMWKPSLTTAERVETARFFLDSIRKRFKLNRIQSDSPLLSCMPEDRIIHKKERLNVRIAVPDDSDALLKNLGHSVRQNIRTAYNRMKRDGIEFKLEVYDADRPISDAIWKELMDLYFERLFSRYKRKKARFLLGRLIQKHLYYNLKHDTHSLHYLPNSMHAVLYFGDRMAAFMSGLKTRDGKVVSVPRLAIDSSFGFYSPGYILITEVIKYISAHPVLCELDLSRGEEKYKTDMGGQLYSTFNYDLKKGKRP
ncbi:MAG: GNAT family N-acetyltransferase [Bacteroidales bacterium]|nr:GNAT family N-acetyltransferase [Bacteroidales bacterium]